jgi:predicted Zn-dependent peptidase
MKFGKLALSIAILAASATAAMAKDYKFTTVKGDPMQTRIYTLDNGLKVYMSVNKEKPRLQTYIAVRTGSRNDPKETTGLAHYLEHLMFKGTNHFGTSNLAAERPLLDSIQNRFEAYRNIKDAKQRKAWYHKIDSLSQLAAKYNIPNEYDKMMAAIGSEGSNAYTSNDVTCYIEDIPSNEIDTWAKVQADRFQNMVVRGFHTELEAVYEEFNIGLANDGEKEWVALNKKLFPTHPYGTQTTIGTQEHLKNPSIVNIYNYYHRYYVPNNVAICMAGDFDPDKAIAIIDKYFGEWKPAKEVTRPEYAPVVDLTAHVDTAVVGQEAENVLLGWKFPKAASYAADTISVIADMLANGKAGLFDVNLNQPMKVMYSAAFMEAMADYSVFVIEALPREGQKLEETKSLILEELDKLKKGEFDADLLQSVLANKKRDFYVSLSDNRTRTEAMKDAFINGQNWDDVVARLNRQSNMTKEQIVAFANKYLADNYVCVYKRQGADTTVNKIDKPAITPIPTNNDKQSDFLKEVVNTKSEPIQPRFVDFKTDLVKNKMKNGAEVLYKQNTQDDLFNLSFVYPVGKENDNTLDIAEGYLEYVGTDKMTASDIQKQFYKLACDFNVSVGDDETRISLSGLNSNMPAALKLASNILNNAKADKQSWQNYVALVLKARADAKTNQKSNFSALQKYGMMGKYNSARNNMSEKELKNVDPQALLNKLNGLGDFTLLYYGPTDVKTLVNTVKKNFRQGKTVAMAEAKPYEEQATPQTEILLAPYDAKNIYMIQYHNENKEWTPENAPVNALFNEYFGGGMNTIVFQELREARGLAYSAAARYNEPTRKGDKESFFTYIITQSDKMMDCVKEFNNLLNDMPARQSGFDLAKQGLLKTLATRRVTKFSVLNEYLRAKKKGLDYDINKTIYEKLPSLKLQDLVDFSKSRISNKPYKYIILGNEKDLDIKNLEKIGTIHRVSTDEIFGY